MDGMTVCVNLDCIDLGFLLDLHEHVFVIRNFLQICRYDRSTISCLPACLPASPSLFVWPPFHRSTGVAS